MCRHALLPPGTSKKQAVKILSAYAETNTDGFGYGYVRNGEFKVFHDPLGFDHAMKKGALNDLPEDSWTLAHLRIASKGKVSKENTHPFIFGDYMVSHNGSSSAMIDIRKALDLTGLAPEWRGETDSEVLAYLVSVQGPTKVASSLKAVGTLLIMSKTGTVWGVVSKAHYYGLDVLAGDHIVASDFRMYPNAKAELMGPGYISFSKEGSLLKKAFEPRAKDARLFESGADSEKYMAKIERTNLALPRHGSPSPQVLSLFRPVERRLGGLLTVGGDGRVQRLLSTDLV